jgi:MFS family permease
LFFVLSLKKAVKDMVLASNRNRTLELIAIVFYGAANGIFVVLSSNFLLALSGSTFYVGLAEGIPAIVTCLIALPAGIFADKFQNELPKNVGLFIVLVSFTAGVLVVASYSYFGRFTVFWLLFGLFCGENFGDGLSSGSISGKKMMVFLFIVSCKRTDVFFHC